MESMGKKPHDIDDGFVGTNVERSKNGPVKRSTISAKQIEGLVEAQEYRCALTGRLLQPADAALDHIIPLSEGGDHVIENAQVLHKQVNRAKHTLTNDEFIRLCREVVAWADRGR